MSGARGPQLNSPQLNEYRQVSPRWNIKFKCIPLGTRGKLSLSSSKPRLNISNRLVELGKNLTPVPSAGLSRYYGELQGRLGRQRPGIKGKGAPVKFAAPLLNTHCCHWHEFNLAGSSSSKPRLNISNRLVELDKNLTGPR